MVFYLLINLLMSRHLIMTWLGLDLLPVVVARDLDARHELCAARNARGLSPGREHEALDAVRRDVHRERVLRRRPAAEVDAQRDVHRRGVLRVGIVVVQRREWVERDAHAVQVHDLCAVERLEVAHVDGVHVLHRGAAHNVGGQLRHARLSVNMPRSATGFLRAYCAPLDFALPRSFSPSRACVVKMFSRSFSKSQPLASAGAAGARVAVVDKAGAAGSAGAASGADFLQALRGRLVVRRELASARRRARRAVEVRGLGQSLPSSWPYCLLYAVAKHVVSLRQPVRLRVELVGCQDAP